MPHYPPIADHGMIGNLRTAALVTAGGEVDWFCAPRFDSPSIFASLLDHDRGGRFSVTADHPGASSTQLYLPDTAVLVTRFLTEDGIGEVVDFMPIEEPIAVDAPHRLVRVVRVVRGSVRFTLDCGPRFDYGRAGHELTLDGGLGTFRGPAGTVFLRATDEIPLRAEGDDLRASFSLRAGEAAVAELTVGGPDAAPPPAPDRERTLDELQRAREFWHRWLRRSTYRGRFQQVVNRSAITLKLLTYAPTGAPVAAATAGLPEQVGGERNWDYRYTWVRDAALAIGALADLGFHDEADAFRRWIGDRVRAGTDTGEPLQIMYRVDGDPALTEETLDHLQGYRGSAPVRIGNGAADQLQLDIYGEAVYGLSRARDLADLAGYDGWRLMSRLVDWLAGHWDRPDEGIWETRGGRKDFTYSRLMCWMAFDRAVRLAARLGRPADLTGWTAARDAVFQQVMDRGWSAERGAFVQHYEGEVLDASLLLMPKTGFLSPRDPRWLSTLDAMSGELVSDSLVYRYDPAASPDGLRGAEGTFSLCSFLYVDALARAGRVDEAGYAFEKMLTYANHVGLFAEEIGPTGEQLGNFPQAFTHLALVNAAMALDEALDRLGD